MKLMTKYRTHNHITHKLMNDNAGLYPEYTLHTTQNTQKQNNTEYTECTNKNHPYANHIIHTTQNNRFINAENNQPKYTECSNSSVKKKSTNKYT
jgi:hypothetical protein